MPGLNVVALTSGGKDSIFTILHCQANGHRVVALANLYPPEDEAHERVEDLGSYMYQTIGHAIIPLYQQALGLPLFRQEILGSAVNQSKSYGPGGESSGVTLDETECLVPLLRRVMLAHPEINAISTGAILSDYQRTRVESVALRLGLVPLSYLWQWPSLPPQTPTSLLEDMAAVGQDARIVQVASGGLDDSFLWQNVSEHRSIARLKKAADRFGTSGDGAILGEGGEFETITIDGPSPLWKGRIVIDPVDTDIIPGEAGSFSLRITKANVEMKVPETVAQASPRVPTLFDPKFVDILAGLTSKIGRLRDEPVTPPIEVGQTTVETDEPDSARDSPINSSESLYTIPQLFGIGANAAEQTRSIMDALLERLAERGLDSTNIIYTVIVLRNMDDFAPVNAVYGSYFKRPNPPARLTIACAEVLPQDAQLLMGFTSTEMKVEGLHVQSRSYWAPANIGPYSQAIKVPSAGNQSADGALVLVAGQIPLVPASMELVTSPTGSVLDGFVHEVVLSLQHLVRIGRVMKVRRWSSAVAFITGLHSDQSSMQTKATILQEAWKSLHVPGSVDLQEPEGEEDTFDVWDLHNRPGQARWRMNQATEPELATECGKQEAIPKLSIIRVDSLPRGSNIEWASYGQTGGTLNSPASDHLHGVLRLFQKHAITAGP